MLQHFFIKFRYFFLFSFALLIFLIHYLVAGQAVYGDGIGYYAHLHSWYFDHDFDSTNEYMHLYTPENNNSASPVSVDHVQIISVSSTKRANNQFSPGSAILLFPFYICADLLVRFLNLFDVNWAANGFSDPYQIMTGIGVIFYSTIALWLTEIFIKEILLVKDKLIYRSIPFFIFFTTFLLFYMSFDVIKSHFASYLFSVLFFLVLLKKDWSKKWWQTLVLGAITGLAGMTRPQDGTLSIIWFLWYLTYQLDWQGQSIKNNLLQLIKEAIYFASVVLIFLSPMFYQWSTLYHSPFEHQNLLDINHNLNKGIDWIGSLVDVKYGFFRRTPINLLAFLVIIYQWYKNKIDRRIWLAIIFFIINHIIVSLHGGWNVAAFGARMYSSSLILVVWGLCEFFKMFDQNRKKIIIALFIIFSLINISSMVSFVLYGKNNEAGNKGTEERTIKRIQQLKERFL